MTTQTKDYMAWLRWSLSDQEARKAGLRSVEDWHLARLVGGSILLAGLLIVGLYWLAQRDERGWESSKSPRDG